MPSNVAAVPKVMKDTLAYCRKPKNYSRSQIVQQEIDSLRAFLGIAPDGLAWKNPPPRTRPDKYYELTFSKVII